MMYKIRSFETSLGEAVVLEERSQRSDNEKSALFAVGAILLAVGVLLGMPRAFKESRLAYKIAKWSGVGLLGAGALTSAGFAIHYSTRLGRAKRASVLQNPCSLDLTCDQKMN